MPAKQDYTPALLKHPRCVARYILVLSLFAAISSTLIAVATDGTLPSSLAFAWIYAQSFFVTLPGIAAALLLRNHVRMALLIGSLLVLLTPALMLLDAIAFHWIGDRFLSLAVWRVFTGQYRGLIGHTSIGMFRFLLLSFVTMAVILAFISWAATRLSRRWQTSQRPAPWHVLLACVLFAILFSMPTLLDLENAKREMARHSSRHPVCVIGLVDFRDVGERPVEPRRKTMERSFVAGMRNTGSDSLLQAVVARDQQQRRLAVDFGVSVGDSARQADVLIVVVESFRRELIASDVMPNLWRYAQRGLHCRSHFSGGNATNHGMFSLLNGLEAIWYSRAVKFAPLLNRLFRSADYEIGFFAGHDDWPTFFMDGYISDEQFDVFETARCDGLRSDRRATQLAAMFLDRNDLSESDPHRPRLAVLYLYATHATYHSYAEDQVFQPAADDRFLYPYSQSTKPAVWNRYKNSAHTIDRFLDAVMRDDRVVIVTGDHGESFLDDGTMGHGIRISEYQNMTPAVVYVPGVEPRIVNAPTTHADLLPTVLSSVGLRLTEPSALDGVNLLAASDAELSERVFATRNYLEDDVALIGPWTEQALRADQTRSHGKATPFAFRISVSVRDADFRAINAIDNRGYAQPSIPTADGEAALSRWIESRFAVSP